MEEDPPIAPAEAMVVDRPRISGERLTAVAEVGLAIAEAEVMAEAMVETMAEAMAVLKIPTFESMSVGIHRVEKVHTNDLRITEGK